MSKAIEKDTLTIGIRKAVSVMALSVFSSVGAGIWVGFATVNSNHFKIIALEQTIKDMKDDYMPVNLLNEKWRNNDLQHEEMLKKLDYILLELKDIRR